MANARHCGSLASLASQRLTDTGFVKVYMLPGLMCSICPPHNWSRNETYLRQDES